MKNTDKTGKQLITELKKTKNKLKITEKHKHLMMELLELLNKENKGIDLIESILHSIKEFTGFEAVGIRLRKGLDFPYYVTIGFPAEFVKAENYLCARDAKGEMIRDSDGNPYMECMCGNVICQRTDPSLPFFTEKGSFWTNCTSELLANTTEKDRQSRSRDRCNGEGYESVALIPLHSNNEIIGLLQLNDRRKGCFTSDSINTFEEIGASVGIALQKQEAERLLREQKGWLEVTLSSIGDGVIATDTKEIITFINREAERMTGWQDKDALGQEIYKVFRIINEGTRDPVEIPIKKALQKNMVVGLANHTILIARDGREISIADSAAPIRDKNNKIHGVVLVFRDISESTKLQRQLIHSEKLSAIGQLAAGIAHEFNNILAIIRGNVQLYLPEAEDNKELFETLKIINRQTERGADIVADMMAFAKPKEPEKEICDVSAAVDDVLRFERKFIDLENIKIIRNYTHMNCVFIDKDQMYQVFLNLINNARHAIMPKGKGVISISIKEIKEKLEISIRDDGIGMDEETRKNVFNPFFSTKGAYARDKLGIKGTGLGMSVSYTIIQNHDGTIDVESEKGKGTRFIIILPITKKEKEKEESKKKIMDSKGLKEIKGLSVLIVDDEKDITDFLERAFKKSKHKDVFSVGSGKAALSIFKERSFDVVFLDMVLPDMKGEKIFKEIKKMNPDVTVVFISGQVGLEEDTLKRNGAYAFIQKPFDINKVFTILNKIVKERKSPGKKKTM